MAKDVENILKTKSFSFAIRIVKLYTYLCESKKEYVLSKQCLRCGTCIGAMVREAEYAASRPDFINKLTVAIKEANETAYWLDLLHATDLLESKLYESLKADIDELLRLLTASIKTSKTSLNKLPT